MPLHTVISFYLRIPYSTITSVPAPISMRFRLRFYGIRNLSIQELEKENSELKRANEILKDALGFFAESRRK